MRHGDYKALLPRREKQWELYDLSEDRQELHDLAETMPDIAREMAAQWNEWAKTHGVN